ncbi:MAG: LLM class F420-dependent oxidoreductase, partial [Nocardioidaceae bacterium]
HREAMAAVPLELIDQTSLIGPPERIVDRLHAYADSGVTTLNVSCFDDSTEGRIATLRTMADALESSGIGT